MPETQTYIEELEVEVQDLKIALEIEAGKVSDISDKLLIIKKVARDALKLVSKAESLLYAEDLSDD